LLKGIEIARQAGELVIVDGLLTLARVSDALGDRDTVRASLQEAMDIAIRSDVTDVDDRMVEMVQARSDIRSGDHDAAYRWAKRRGLLAPAADRAEATSWPRMRKYELAVLASLYLAEGRHSAALAALDEAQPLLEKRGRTAALLEILTLKAIAYLGLGDPDRAEDALLRALTMAEPSTCILAFAEAGDVIVPLLQALAAQDIAPALVRRILEVRAGTRRPDGAPPLSESQLLRPVQPARLVEPLTEREAEILPLLATHLTSTEIAEHLYIATSTARTHIKSIYGKLGVHSRDDAVLRARTLGLLS
jgi:LuxR family transcriptional regulator, maltose regulon positive regulatory protein